MGALSRALVLVVLLAQVALGQSADLAWREATQQSEPWTRWWWMGSAVDRENLTAELETLAAAGFGGVEVTSIYGVRGYEHAFVPYLSDRWLDLDRKSTRLNSSHSQISYAVFCLKKKKNTHVTHSSV